MPTEDRSGTWYANRQRARAIYSQHKIEEQALNQGTANRMNSNGASSGTSTVLYASGTASGTGEELAAVLQANSAVPPLPPAPPAAPIAPTNVTAFANGPESFSVSWAAPSPPVTLYTVVASPGDITKTSPSNTFLTFGQSDGIVLGTTYTFVVTAENDIGTSPPSDPSAPVKAITYADPPMGVNATDGENGQSTVSWTASAYDGESTITGYRAYSSSGQEQVIHSTIVSGSDTSAVVTGLTNGFSYIFYVTTINGLGEGTNPSISSAGIMPLGPPTQPLNVVAYAGDGNANVTWDAPLSDGGASISAYIVTSSPVAFFPNNIVPPFPQFLSLTASGLTNGIPYTFTVYATNSKGNSLLSDPSSPVTPLGFPDPPTNVIAVPGNASASVSWDASVNTGGSPIESYTVVSTPDGISITVSGLSTTVPGLANGFPYTFTVFATNEINSSSVESIPSSPVIPRTVPSAPRLPVGLSGNTQIDLAWLVPLSDGGSPIINYTVTSFPAASGPQSTTDASTSLLITGLTNGVAYTFTVYATNSAGNSIESVLSDPITPTGANVPDPPGGVSAILDLLLPGKITVSWATPVSDGGSAITSYTVTPDPADVPPESVPPSNSFVFDNVLTNGTPYTFTVIATNGVGSSLASVPSPSVTPAIAPSVPQNFIVTPRNQGAILTWSPPLSTGGTPISIYTGYFYSGTQIYPDWIVPGNVFTYVVPDTLTNGTLYTFSLANFNSQEGGVPLYASTYINVSAIPDLTVADPPSIISVEGSGVSDVKITFTPSSYDGGGVFVEYLVEQTNGPFTATPTSSPAILGPLQGGDTYAFTVKTVTSVGTSAPSAPSSSITA